MSQNRTTDDLNKLIISISNAYHFLYPVWPNPPELYLIEMEKFNHPEQTKIKKWTSSIKANFNAEKNFSGELKYTGNLIIETAEGEKRYSTNLTYGKLNLHTEEVDSILNLISYHRIIPKIELKSVKSIKAEADIYSEFYDDNGWDLALFKPFKTCIETLEGDVYLEDFLVWIGKTPNDIKNDKNIIIGFKPKHFEQIQEEEVRDRFLANIHMQLLQILLFSKVQQKDFELKVNNEQKDSRNYADDMLFHNIDTQQLVRLKKYLYEVHSPKKEDNVQTLTNKFKPLLNILSQLYLVRIAGFKKSYEKLKDLTEYIEDLGDQLDKRISALSGEKIPKIIEESKKRKPPIYIS